MQCKSDDDDEEEEKKGILWILYICVAWMKEKKVFL